jgi:hypothetical protein
MVDGFCASEKYICIAGSSLRLVQRASSAMPMTSKHGFVSISEMQTR